MQNNIDIFYKTYAKDFDYLYYSLKSLTKFVIGYNRVIIVIPQHDKHLFNYDYLPNRCDVYFVDEPVNNYTFGYLYQQYIKMTAFNFSKAEYIMFNDSDSIFKTKINAKNFINKGKPIIYYTDYNKVGDAICWKAPTERFINKVVDYEFMRRIPLVYHTETLKNISEQYNELYNIIMGSGAFSRNGSVEFSEFNAIGAWSFFNEKDKYTFIDTDTCDVPKRVSNQYWSWDSLDKNKEEIETILKG